MLSGKMFLRNVRALRMLVEELLRPLFGKDSFHNMDDLLQEVDAISVESKTSQLWVIAFFFFFFFRLFPIRGRHSGFSFSS